MNSAKWPAGLTGLRATAFSAERVNRCWEKVWLSVSLLVTLSKHSPSMSMRKVFLPIRAILAGLMTSVGAKCRALFAVPDDQAR